MRQIFRSKLAGEDLICKVDFASYLAAGETILEVVGTTVTVSVGTLSTYTVTSTLDGTTAVRCIAKDGSEGSIYENTTQVITSLGQTLDISWNMAIAPPPYA